MKERSLSDHLQSWILPFVFAVGALISLSNYLIARRTILQELSRGVDVAAQAASGRVQGLWDQYRNDVITLSQSPLFRDYATNRAYGLDAEARVYRGEIERMLLDFSRRSRAFPRLRFLDLSGREICRVQDSAARAPSSQVDEAALLDSRLIRPGLPRMSDVQHPSWHAHPVVAWTAGIFDDAGAPRGLLVFEASLGPTDEALSRFRIGRSGRVRLLERPEESLPATQRSVTARAAVPGTPWSVAMTVDRREFLRPLAEVLTATVLFSLLAALLLSFGLRRQLHILLAPVRTLADAAGAIADGALDTRVAIAAPREVGRLARAFNAMAVSLTEKKRLQSQLIQSEKLSVVGRLISGVAHELNNPLAAVTGYAELLKDIPARPEEREDLRQMHASALRCRDIVQGLLSYARPGDSPPQRVALNDVAAASLALLEYRLARAEGIALETDLDPASPAVAGDVSRLQQVLVNLLTNAGDAVRGRPGRVIRLRTRVLPDGARLDVEDNGPGVPAALRARLFEPFVTTKPAGSGTGLGLSICAQLAAEMGATIQHEDVPGGGARFTLLFPACPASLKAANPAADLPPPCPGARVLVIDDEPVVVQLMSRILSEDGLAPTGVMKQDAARIALERADFDLIVCDVDLGGVTGFALLDEPRAPGRARPAVVFVTGDVLNRDYQREAAARGAPLLAKPFLRKDFLRVVRRALRR